MAIKLHRCPVMFAKSSRHPCWKVQKALDDAAIDYEVVKHPILKSMRSSFAGCSGQRLLPAIEFEDGTILREESTDLAARIRDGRLPRTRDTTSGGRELAPGSTAGPKPSRACRPTVEHDAPDLCPPGDGIAVAATYR